MPNYLGAAKRFSAELRESTGTLVDPTVVKFIFLSPSGTTTTYTYDSTNYTIQVPDSPLETNPLGELPGVVKESGIGRYSIIFTPSEIGKWYWGVVTSGSHDAVEQQELVVIASQIYAP